MDNSLKEIANIISTSFENQKAQFPELADENLTKIFKLDIADFMLFCCINEAQITPVELQFLNENLDMDLSTEYFQQYWRSVSDVNEFKLPLTFLIASIIQRSTRDQELLNTCYMFYQLVGQRYFQLRPFFPATTDRYNYFLHKLESYVQSEQVETEKITPQAENSADPSLPPRTEANLMKCMDELYAMTGLKRVKEDVQSLVNMIVVRKKRDEIGVKQQLPLSLHLVFTGNPGTGKTTVARLLAKIYYQLGLLSKGQLVETDRSGLVAGYIGQTAIKTQEVIQKAIGGILFIDEAYTLKQNYSNDFGQECIDTILKAMEDNRDDLIVIVAGYPDLMQEFIKSNPGLQSRFNKYLTFDDYTPDELVEIFQSLCDLYGMTADDEVIAALKEKLDVLYQNRGKSFGNGRLVRNIVEKVYANQANRLADVIHECSPKELVQIKSCDLPDLLE